jgi:D-threo-aldose 1-dehydrogenase
VPEPTARVPLGRSGLRVTRLGLGCAPLGNMLHALSDAQAQATVDAAWATGLRWFDTAPLYGHGLSEQRLGRALRPRPRGEYVLATKVGRRLVPGVDPDAIFVDVPPRRPIFDFSADGVRGGLTESLARLGLERVDVLHIHDPDAHEAEALAGAVPALARLRADGVIGAIGVGMNQWEMPARFVAAGAVDCVLLAGRYSLLDQSGLELLESCARAGVAVIAAGVFNSGLLADPVAGATFDYAPAAPALVQRAQRLAAVCARHGVPLRAAALQFPTLHPAVASVLTGARSPAEIAANVRDFALPIPPDLWNDLQQQGLLRPDALAQA